MAQNEGEIIPLDIEIPEPHKDGEEGEENTEAQATENMQLSTEAEAVDNAISEPEDVGEKIIEE